MDLLEEKRPSLTSEEQLTPIVINTLKEESKKRFHQSQDDHRRVEAFMSALNASVQDLRDTSEPEQNTRSGLSPELIIEVNSVLSKLMNSLNKHYDPKLIPIIQGLQASLNSKQQQREEQKPRFRNEDHSTTSKIPWKIRAARKRAIKHHTTGMTKEEFERIMRHDPPNTLSSASPAQSPFYSLSRNKSESFITAPSKKEVKVVVNFQDSIKTTDLGYASDVCDYNVQGNTGGQHITDPKSEEATKPSNKSPKKSSKSGSAVRATIARRKMMRQANSIDNPQGSLSDQESMMDDDEKDDSAEEKQDKEVIRDKNSKKHFLDLESVKDSNNNNSFSSSSANELTPEMGRKDWNSRFSNIKNSFASSSDLEVDLSPIDKSRSPSFDNNNNNNNNSNRKRTRAKSKEDKNKFNSNVITTDDKKYIDLVARARSEKSISKSKSKQPTPSRETNTNRLSKSLPRESRNNAEAMGMEPSNKNNNDMDYQEYMNIINRVRRTKESTRVRTEQFRLASMYAQEKRRQDELKREEERLKLEREKVEREKEEKSKMMTQSIPDIIPFLESKRDETDNTDFLKLDLNGVEKGQLDNDESEQQKTTPVLDPHQPAAAAAAALAPGPPLPTSSSSSFSKPKEHEQKELMERERQRVLREAQVRAEQEKLEKLRQEQIRQEKEREEIRQLEFERLQQIQEEQRKLDEERRRQQEHMRIEQIRLEEERKKQEKLQAEKNAEYNRQRLDIEAQHCALAQETRAKLKDDNDPILSPEEKIIRNRLSQQDKLRQEHKQEETKIRQEKLKLIQQEEMLISRQEEMLRQIEAERQNLMKQEELIRSKQQSRLQQVRQEKMLLERQEEMLRMREQQLMHERIRQDNLRKEQQSLREQEQVIRKRQEQISKELMGETIMECEALEGQVFIGRKPKQYLSPAVAKNDDNDEEGEDDDDEEEEEEEEFYESKVEVQQKPTSIPTSVRTIETINAKPWAPVTPYLNNTCCSEQEIKAIFPEEEKKTSGIITSPESARTSSSALITTPENSSVGLPSIATPGSSATASPGPPPIPPLPLDDDSFHPEIPPRLSSYNILAEKMPEPEWSLTPPVVEDHEHQQCRFGGPGSAFKPYSIFEDPSSSKPPLDGSNLELHFNGDHYKKPIYSKVKELRKPIRPPFSTTDTEPEMKECHFPATTNKRGKLLQQLQQMKASQCYSTSETEEENYLRSRPKMKYKNSWDPFQVDSPPQITQKPVGVIQKPKPQQASLVVAEQHNFKQQQLSLQLQQKQQQQHEDQTGEDRSVPQETTEMVPLSVAEINKKKVAKEEEEEEEDGGGGGEGEEEEEEGKDKRKALHQQLMNEAVTFRKKDHLKKFNRTNPTIAAMEIMTRKELKTCEMEERFFKEKQQQSPQIQPRQQKKLQPQKQLQPRKRLSPPPPPSSSSSSSITPTIILKKEPKRLDSNELQVRQDKISTSTVDKKKEEYIESLSRNEKVKEEISGIKIKREKVKKAAELFERSDGDMETAYEPTTPGKNLPWTKSRNYALRMSKSSDSITAAKLYGLRINKDTFSASSESGGVNKSRDEIRKILSIAKQSSSVTERIKIFNDQIAMKSEDEKEEENDLRRREKAEAIKREIREAKEAAKASKSSSIEFQNPVEVKVKPLKIPMKPKIDTTAGSRLRINRRTSDEDGISTKKVPKLLMKSKSHVIYAQSATDYSEDDIETIRKENRNYLRVPSSKNFGLSKSKSFGQYECVLSDEEIDEKQRTIMSFFNGNDVRAKGARKKYDDDGDGDDDEEEEEEEEEDDVDAVFESLLQTTFHKEESSVSIVSNMNKVSDPLEALPKSHNKRYLPRQQTWAGMDSSSPLLNQQSSEYDTCDPWEDY